ncbi:hypothetical protein L5F09_00360 [Aliarcobacter butzleri]|uniref:hypothetical protein n=1 Tax=Aliarcobacter butzleri TaxID=28197 RepID=UPI001EDC2C9C|nr:hypothetical protein [Aliarcobacter butzleri]MCG3664193.1 hypothetical protein [Aliarcobacter butzleri]
MGIELIYLPFIIFAIPTFIYFYRKVNSKPKKIAVVLVAMAIPIYHHFYYNVYIENLRSQPLSFENQKKLEKYLINFKYTYIRHHQFFAPPGIRYLNPVLRDLKNKKNQEYIKELYIKYLNNDGQITYKEVSSISIKINDLARYEK